ncbi:hypothetical protein WICANDRAFT_75842 [Wickerhamomyces anomalus NRRL Y-366-8]|uniref:Uncharacterized protein n=1 Tax=Wickerhamomyces anomalus (strain ATCC 58044 / CBS 1984 / NCYC 433 / NRRL Y-366-8) TaxID=683960 RepID=A0A1E3P895_WICAA|nr:uncharacterized protein WICANDRAFT_75842 [Wickerhamomyces anomalus NRRL Y-366-8]ODQ61636.1 hypothetical protein WICANDRAFT_75842 [Wickerhamomyces anomalus NRRL Y-366-8]
MFKKLFKRTSNNEFTVRMSEPKESYYLGDRNGLVFETQNIGELGLNLKEIMPRVIDDVDHREFNEIPMILSELIVTDYKGNSGTIILLKPADSDMVTELEYFGDCIRKDDESAFIDPNPSRSLFKKAPAIDNFRMRVTFINIPKSIKSIDLFEYLVKHPPLETKVVFVNVDITNYYDKGEKNEEQFVLNIIKSQKMDLKDQLKEFEKALAPDQILKYPKVFVKMIMTFHQNVELLPSYTETELPAYSSKE